MSDENLKIFFLCLIVVFIIIVFLIIKSRKIPFKYKSKDKIVTEVEQVLLGRLNRCFVNKPFYIGYQIALNRIVSPDAKKKKNYYFLSSKIGSKSVDFLIMDKCFKPLLAIELDDSSHNNISSKKRDIVKDRIFKSAGIVMVRFTVKQMPNVSQLENYFFNPKSKISHLFR